MKKINFLISLFVCVCCGALLLVGCSKKDENVLRVVTEATFPPYEFRNSNGEICGIDIDLCKIVADRLGKKLVVEDTKFESVIPSVVEGRADVAAAGITITEERKRKVLFSVSYARAAQMILVRIDSPITGVENLPADAKIGCQTGTTAYDYILKEIVKDKTSERIQAFDTDAIAVSALVSKKLDAVVVDEGPAKKLAAQNAGKVKCLDKPLTSEEYVIAFNKNNPELCEVFSQVITELKNNGEMDKIIERYNTQSSK